MSKTISVRLVEMIKDQGVKNNGLTFLEEINSEWASRSRLQVHPPQQVVEAWVVAEGVISRVCSSIRVCKRDSTD